MKTDIGDLGGCFAVENLFDKILFVAKKLFGLYKCDDEVSQENDKIIFPA